MLTEIFGKPSFIPAVFCSLTFWVVTFVIGDAVVPVGFMIPLCFGSWHSPGLGIILLIPTVGLVVASFLRTQRIRGVFTGLCVVDLVVLWILGLYVLVVHPPYPTPDSGSPIVITSITSVPFVIAVIFTLIYSGRIVVVREA